MNYHPTRKSLLSPRATLSAIKQKRKYLMRKMQSIFRGKKTSISRKVNHILNEQYPYFISPNITRGHKTDIFLLTKKYISKIML